MQTGKRLIICMKKGNDKYEELSKMGSPLAGMPDFMPFSVPQEYFEKFNDELQFTIKSLEVPEVIPDWSKTQPFSVPDKYFEELTDNIVAAATSGEVIRRMPKTIPLTTPQGYFEALPGSMLVAAKATEISKKGTLIIPLNPKSFLLPKRWAAAAIIFITIGLGGIEFFSAQAPATDKILASVPNNEIQDYLQHSVRFDIDRITGGNEIVNLPLENNEIIEYLNDSGWD